MERRFLSLLRETGVEEDKQGNDENGTLFDNFFFFLLEKNVKIKEQIQEQW